MKKKPGDRVLTFVLLKKACSTIETLEVTEILAKTL